MIANGNQPGQWVSFTFGTREDVNRPGVGKNKEGSVVRVAKCNLPPSRNVHMAVKKQLLNFGSHSWVGKNLDRLNAAQKEKGNTSSEFVCTRYWVYKINGQIVSVLGCADWEYIPSDDAEQLDPSLGGGGGSPPDPCAENANGEIPEKCQEEIEEPCPGDPVDSPEIAPTDGQGTDGGRYGAGRSDGTPHNGLDIKSPLNDPLHSMFSGGVYAAIHSSGDFGNYVIVRSNYGGENIYVLYAHLNSLNVSSGESVNIGDILGKTGDTGNAAGTVPHVHIEVRKYVSEYGYNDAPSFDPEDYMSTQFDEEGNPIPPENCN